MKKTAIVLVLVLLCCTLFAESFVDGSLGYAFLRVKETTTVRDITIVQNQKTSALSTEATFMFFPGTSRFGADLGLSVLFPISVTVNEREYDVSFFDCDYCPRIGLAWKADLDKNLVMLSSLGYQVMMDFESKTSGGRTAKTKLFIHGVYAQDRLVYKLNGNVRINAGLTLYFPIVGTVTTTISGIEGKSKQVITYSGVLINPFIGIDIKTK